MKPRLIPILALFAVAIIAFVCLHGTSGLMPSIAGGLAVIAMLGTVAPVLPEAEFQDKVLKGIEDQKTKGTELETQLKTANGEIEKLKTALNTEAEERAKLQKALQTRLVTPVGRQRSGIISDDAARCLAAHFIIHCERSGKLEALSSESRQRDFLRTESRSILGITVKTALDTSDIPLPVQYGGQIVELISDFGIVRNRMSRYPIGMGTAKPARMGTRPAFGSIAMSAPIGEKSPTIDFAALESHKLGGLVRMPREIDEQSIVPMGQYLARYGAVEFARAEDTWGFLADGTATYESVKGVVQICRDNGKTVVLDAGKTKPSDATIDDFSALRRKVNKAALSGRLSAYYLDTTWETVLRRFNTEADPYIYVRLPDGSATLEGYPIVWTDVLTPYSTGAAADSAIACFGALSFYWFGEHGTPRLDTSEHVFFANDQLAVRFIEEIDIDYNAVDSMATLLTAGA